MAVIHDMARMQADGMSREEIAQFLGVGLEWVDWVMDADGFKVVEEDHEEGKGKG